MKKSKYEGFNAIVERNGYDVIIHIENYNTNARFSFGVNFIAGANLGEQVTFFSDQILKELRDESTREINEAIENGSIYL
jgi:hypothetical protein